MALEIVDLPIKNGWIFHSYVNVYQRVSNWMNIKQQTQLVLGWVPWNPSLLAAPPPQRAAVPRREHSSQMWPVSVGDIVGSVVISPIDWRYHW